MLRNNKLERILKTIKVIPERDLRLSYVSGFMNAEIKTGHYEKEYTAADIVTIIDRVMEGKPYILARIEDEYYTQEQFRTSDATRLNTFVTWCELNNKPIGAESLREFVNVPKKRY